MGGQLKLFLEYNIECTYELRAACLQSQTARPLPHFISAGQTKSESIKDKDKFAEKQKERINESFY